MFWRKKSETPLIDAARPVPPSWGGTANLLATADRRDFEPWTSAPYSS